MKLLASDYDGTLFRNLKVSSKDIESIRKFREEGNLFGIVTGRPFASIEHELIKKKIPYDFIIGINGGYIEDKEKNVIFHKEISLEIADQLVAQIKKEDVQFAAIGDGISNDVFIADKKLKTRLKKLYFQLFFKKKPRNPKLVRNFVTHVNQKQDSELLVKRLMNLFGDSISCHRNRGMTIDISGSDVGKEKAVQIVKDHFSADEVYVIGDSYNDINMIEKFNGFTVTSASEEIKSIASKVFANFTDLVNFILER